MLNPPRFASLLTTVATATVMSGCAATTVAVTPSPQTPVCDRDASALVLWMPGWRPDQKDITEREAAAAKGLQTFFGTSGCFARAEIRRLANGDTGSILTETRTGAGRADKTVFIAVRELGPVVKLLSSATLVEGGTQVVLDVTEYSPPTSSSPRHFSVNWQNGGPGVIKGVSSLPVDMETALAAALQPGRTASCAFANRWYRHVTDQTAFHICLAPSTTASCREPTRSPLVSRHSFSTPRTWRS